MSMQIFALTSKEIHKVVEKFVVKSVIDLEFNVLKIQAIKGLMELNKKAKGQKEKSVPSTKLLRLLEIRKSALK